MGNDEHGLHCSHCMDTGYVFVYWFNRLLDQKGVHMADIPLPVFKDIPVELFMNCHCSVALLLPSKVSDWLENPFRCQECDGTSWRFTEIAQQSGYRWKKIINLDPAELKGLPCEYFERCPCGDDDQAPRSSEKKKILKDVFELLRVKIPRLGFSFIQVNAP